MVPQIITAIRRCALARARAIALAAVACALTWTHAADATRHPLSLDQCIQMAIQSNLDLQVDRLDPQIARYALRGAYGAYDPVLHLDAGRSYEDNPADMDPKKDRPDAAYQITTDSYGFGLSGNLPTGLSYGLGAEAAHRSAETFFLATDPTLPGAIRLTNNWLGTAALTLDQPILRNFWIDEARQTIRVNRKNLKIAELGLKQEIINTVTKVQLAYYDLVMALEQVKVQRKAVELANQLLLESRQRVQAGLLTPLDEKQAEARLASAQASEFAARQAVDEAQEKLKLLITDDLRSWADVTLDPTETLVALPRAFDREESWRRALRLRPDLAQLRLESEKRDIVVKYRFNQLFPALDVQGSYGARSVQTDFGELSREVADLSHPSYSYGVVFTLPLANIAARNDYRASQALKQQTLLQVKRLEQSILSQVVIAGKQLEPIFGRVKATQQARENADVALSFEEKKLQVGQSTYFIVLELQRTLTEARLAEVRALSDYNKAQVELAFSEGSTLEENSLRVEWK